MREVFKKDISRIDFYPVWIYLIWRSLILIFQVFLQTRIFSFDHTTLFQRLYLYWVTLWDSGHYLKIALKGYVYPEQAYFPFWPFLLKSLSLSGISIYKIDFILSIFISFLMFVLFYQLALRLMGKDQAKLALIFLAAFPGSFFLLAGYSESLFLALVLAAFLLMEKGHYFLSSLVAAPSSMTRFAGLGLAATYLFLKTKFSQKIILAFTASAGLAIYMIYLGIVFGNPFIFFLAERESGRFHVSTLMTFPWQPIIDYAVKILNGTQKLTFDFYFLDWSASLLFVGLLLVTLKRLNIKYFLYAAFAILLPLSSGKFDSLIRYGLAAFPAFFVFPSLIKSKIFFYLICLGLFLIQLWLMTRFLNYLWVA